MVLANLCESVTDGDHQTPKFTNEGVPFIFVGNVSRGYLHFEGAKHVSEEYFAGLRETRKPRRGDILFSAVGATLGIPAIIDCDISFCFQRHVAILRPISSCVIAKFLWYMLRSATVYRLTWEATTGSAQPTIPLRGIRALPVPVPPLSEQRQIVAHLDDGQTKIDHLKATYTQTQKELNALLPSILDKAFKGEL